MKNIILVLFSLLFISCANKNNIENYRLGVIYETQTEEIDKDVVSNVFYVEKQMEYNLNSGFDYFKYDLLNLNNNEKTIAYKTSIITNKLEYINIYLPIKLNNNTLINFYFKDYFNYDLIKSPNEKFNVVCEKINNVCENKFVNIINVK